MQPTCVFLTSLWSCFKGLRCVSEMFIAGILVWFLTIIALMAQFGVLAVLFASLWSVVWHFNKNLTAAMMFKERKLHAYSVSLAALVTLAYSAVKIVWNTELAQETSLKLFLEQVVVYFICSFTLLMIPAKATKNHTLTAIGYLVPQVIGVFVMDIPYVMCLYTLTSVVSVSLTTYSIDSDLPLTTSQPGLFSHIMSHKDSQRIAVFLSVNFTFMFVEAIYGYWTNSLGLISDSIHMAFDCTALAIGLYASYISKLPADKEYPYGHMRYEVLSGFINAIFLIFIGLHVFVESIERIITPPEITNELLMIVSCMGLLVNLLGLVFFGCADGHSNSNMEGVFLHVLADALGSVGVIVSSFFVIYFEWYIADPICSLIIAILILVSVVPLLQDSVKVLMEKDIGCKVKKIRKKLEGIPGVEVVQSVHVWKLSGDQHVVAACIQAATSANPLKITEACKGEISYMNSIQVS